MRLSAILLLPMCLASALLARVFQDVPYKDHQDLLYFLDGSGARQAVKTPADWEVRRKHILKGMERVMGPLPGKEKRSPLKEKVAEEKKVGTLVRRKISYQSEPGKRVPAYLFVPAGARKAPAVLCLHQTNKHGMGEPAGIAGNPNYHYALHLAERGYVTLAPDYPGFNEHTWKFVADSGYDSGTMKALWDNVRGVDLLESLEEVDAERIGVIGHSLGGHNAMFTAAFEPRLKVIVSSCGFTRFGKDDMPSWTGPTYMPRIAKDFKNDAGLVPFDFPEVIAAFAPRPFLACAAVRDNDFDVGGVKDSIASARPIYELLGKSGHLAAHYPDCGHDFPADARKVAYDFLDKHLKRR